MAYSNTDINKIIASAYKTALELQNAATSTVGTQCLWARATPVINSEDVVLQEYTLSHVGLECPQSLQVIVGNPDYNPGNYIIDDFGLNYETNLELNITIDEWKKHFGQDTQPQQNDVVYVQIYHKLFEVRSANVIYSLAALPTYYKCILSKYNPTMSRQETEEFRESVEDLTVSQEELFGDLISQQVADNNATVETSYNNTTYVDPQKEYDIKSIIVEQVYGSKNNLISNAYYDFSAATMNIKYHDDLIYELNAERNHLIYSCWFRKITTETDIKSGKIRTLNILAKDAKYWYLQISETGLKLNIGDNVTITRGTLIKINGTVIPMDCTNGYAIQINAKDMLKANKKLTNWYNNPSTLKIYKYDTINLLTGFSEADNTVFNISYNNQELYIEINNKIQIIPIKLNLNNWHYILFDIYPNNIRIVINKIKQEDLNTMIDELCLDTTINFNLTDFNVNYFMIQNMGINVNMCNIRLYENEYEMNDLYLQDMYSPVTVNASKLILVDTPNVPNKDIFISPIK